MIVNTDVRSRTRGLEQADDLVRTVVDRAEEGFGLESADGSVSR